MTVAKYMLKYILHETSFLLLKQSLSLHHMNIWKQWNVTYIIIIWWFTPCLVLPILYIYIDIFDKKIGDYWWITQYRAKGMNKAFSVHWKPGKRQWPQKKRLKILLHWKLAKKEWRQNLVTLKTRQTDCLDSVSRLPIFRPLFSCSWHDHWLTCIFYLWNEYAEHACVCWPRWIFSIFFSHKKGCFYGPGGWGKILCVLSKVGK